MPYLKILFEQKAYIVYKSLAVMASPQVRTETSLYEN